MINIETTTVRIAFHGVMDRFGKCLIKLPFNCKAEAEAIVNELNTKNAGTRESFHLQILKQDLVSMDNSIVTLAQDTRMVKGFTEDKNGETFQWVKTFYDLFIISKIDVPNREPYYLDTTVTYHYRKGKLHVVGYKSFDDFMTYARARWPKHWQMIEVYIRP